VFGFWGYSFYAKNQHGFGRALPCFFGVLFKVLEGHRKILTWVDTEILVLEETYALSQEKRARASARG